MLENQKSFHPMLVTHISSLDFCNSAQHFFISLFKFNVALLVIVSFGCIATKNNYYYGIGHEKYENLFKKNWDFTEDEKRNKTWHFATVFFRVDGQR